MEMNHITLDIVVKKLNGLKIKDYAIFNKGVDKAIEAMKELYDEEAELINEIHNMLFGEVGGGGPKAWEDLNKEEKND